jgi:ribosomal protein S18 acetylase RimI-like enzyme
VTALDARVVVRAAADSGIGRLAIRPYPDGLEEQVRLRTGETVMLRPIRPEDEAAHAAFFGHLEQEDLRFRFFTVVKAPDHDTLARFTQIDYDREMCFIATRAKEGGAETLGVVRAIADPDNERAEYAIIVRSDMKGAGLGQSLMDKLIAYARARGTKVLWGEVLPNNDSMLDLAARLGFQVRPSVDGTTVRTELTLS